jgi:hypothetical protein
MLWKTAQSLAFSSGTAAALGRPSEDLEKEKKKGIWTKLLSILEILGYGFSKLDLRLYAAWWETLMDERGGDLELDEKGRDYYWNGIPIKMENFSRWVEEKIRQLQVACLPMALRRFSSVLLTRKPAYSVGGIFHHAQEVWFRVHCK